MRVPTMRVLRVCLFLGATVPALSAGFGCGSAKNEDITTPTSTNPSPTPGMEKARGVALRPGRKEAGNAAAQPDGGK